MSVGKARLEPQEASRDATLPGFSSSDLRRLALSGSLWTFLGYGLSQLLRLAAHMLLARLLFPEAFGLMAIVNVFVHALQMFADLGITTSIVQSARGEDRAFLDTAWTLQILRGGGVWLASVLVAWPVAAAYAQPQLKSQRRSL